MMRRSLLCLILGAVTIAACADGGASRNELRLTSIVAGNLFTCGLDDERALWCWGVNEYGQLGVGDLEDRTQPVAVSLPTPTVHLAAGETKVCAVDSLSALRCWGENAFYSLADSSVPFRPTPAPLPVGRVRHVAAGSRFICATDAEGHASCWGTDLNGQLGDGGDTVEKRMEPKRVAAELAFDTIVAGRIHVCGLAADGAAWCWGGAGLAGDGSREKRLEPARVSGGHLFRSLTAASGVTCGIAQDAAAWCWGLGSDGQLGNGAGIPNDFVPVAVAGGRKFRQLAAGYHRVCGLDVDGLAWCWGSNFNGVLGDTGRVSSPVPVRVRGDRRYETIASGDSHACAIERGGKVWCWGQNRAGDRGGALGDGTIEDRSFPVAVAPKLIGTSGNVPPSSPSKR